MINNSILCADAQVCNNLDVRVKHEYDRKRKMLKHDNIIEQSGRSMIEMLGVLAIVGVLSVGGIAGYSKAMEKFKINKTADQISQIVTNIRTLYAQQTTYAGLNTATAIQMGVTPDELGSDTTLTNAFAGSIDIYASPKTSTSSNDAFGILVCGISKEACVSLATMDWGSSYSSGLIAVQVASDGAGGIQQPLDTCSSRFSSYSAIQCSKDGPMPIVSAATICNTYATDADLCVSMKFY